MVLNDLNFFENIVCRKSNVENPIKIFNSSILDIGIPENRDPGLIEIDERTGEVTAAIESNYDKELGTLLCKQGSWSSEADVDIITKREIFYLVLIYKR